MDIREFFRNRLCFSAIICQYSRFFSRSFNEIRDFSKIADICDFIAAVVFQNSRFFRYCLKYSRFFLRSFAEIRAICFRNRLPKFFFSTIVHRNSHFDSVIVYFSSDHLPIFAILFYDRLPKSAIFSRSFPEFRDFILRSFDKIYDFFFLPPI